MIDTRVAFTGLVALVAAERLVELIISERNRRAALARGGEEVGQGHYPVMVLLHTGILVAAPLEVWLLQRPFVLSMALAGTLLLAATMALRYWVIATLGRRWCTRVVGVPGTAPIASGPFRFLRHPNYLAVIVELAALPLIHAAWLTALLFGIANALLLRVRIGVEDAALVRWAKPAAPAP